MTYPRQYCWVSALVLVGLALLLRFAAFGDPVANVDDQFYMLVGARMHEGLVPYVDIWDRKPPGIFVIYYLLASLSTAPVFYQVVAALFAAATASVIAAIVRRWAGWTTATLAGALYLVTLGPFFGNSGQTPVFYNLGVALAAWLLTGPAGKRRFDLAMLMLGLALTVKQTVAIEAAAFGLFAVWRLGREGWFVNVLRFIAIGLAPTLLGAAVYFGLGHFAAYWSATVMSIFAKAGPSEADVLGRSLDLARRFVPLLVLALLGLALKNRNFEQYRLFVVLWTLAALAGVVAVPQLYLHYGLPLVLPLAVAASPLLDRRVLGPGLGFVAVAASMIYQRPFDFARHARSRAEIAAVVAVINRLPGDSLLVFEGPTALYTLTDRRTVSPLVFPPHLNHAAERSASGGDAAREVAAILARRPAVIVLTPHPRNRPENAESWALVRNYLAQNCTRAASLTTHEMGRQQLLIHACPE